MIIDMTTTGLIKGIDDAQRAEDSYKRLAADAATAASLCAGVEYMARELRADLEAELASRNLETVT
jgi:hypothetical protein